MLNKAIIDLERIEQNAKEIKKSIPSLTKFCAVIKDDAYGHGLVEVAHSIYSIVDYYAVKNIEEAKKLRYSGIDKNILILIPVGIYEIEDAVRFNFTLTIASMLDARKLCLVLNRVKQKIKIHIKYNTGMNRQGIDSIDALREIIEYLLKCEWVIIEGFYSHFSFPENKRYRKRQVNNFLLAKNVFLSYNIKVISHISASGGFLMGEYFDMVRIGILLYGYKPFKNRIDVKPCMKIIIPVIQKRELRPFNCALYGNRRTLLKRDFYLIRFGYGDGIFRKRIKGQFSNKCMDLSLVSDDKNSFGYIENNSFIIDDFSILSKRYKTITYEIMVDITKNCERIYRR